MISLMMMVSLISCFPQKNNPLEGFWDDSYPVNDSSGGFLFLKNRVFYYFHLSNKNIERRYVGSFGEWRISNSDIEIKITKHFFLQNPVILQNSPAAKYLIGSNNHFRYLDLTKSDWQKIGDIEKIMMTHFPSMFKQKGVADEGVILPCVMLPLIDNAEIKESTLYYQTETGRSLSFYVTDMVKKLKNAKKGTEKEWHPGNPVQVIQSTEDTATE
jgi:hypothetical protein